MNTTKILILCSLASCIVACSGGGSKQESVRSVKCDTVSRVTTLRDSAVFPGRVKAASDANLAFRISGPIAKVNVTEGQYVRKGDVIVEMDARDYKTQLAATEAEYKKIKGEADRVIELYNKQSATPNDHDKAVYGLQQIAAKLEAHRNALADTRLVAPFDGYIQKKFYSAGETVSAGMPVISIISTTAPEVEINIPTGDFVKRKDFASAECSVDIFENRTFALDLIGIAQKANLNQLYTTRFRIRGSGSELPAPGMTTMVTIYYKNDSNDMMRIPISAVLGDGDSARVWIVKDGYVSSRPIIVTKILTDGSAIVSKGVSEGDIVVSAGVNHLKEGQAVKVLENESVTNVGNLL